MSLQDEYNYIVSNLSEFCRGRGTCNKCGGRGERLDRTEDWGEPTYYHCTTCNGTGIMVTECGGWIVTDLDTIHQCPLHYKGQPHPED
jgi:DnaJ-class molecular chaperone